MITISCAGPWRTLRRVHQGVPSVRFTLSAWRRQECPMNVFTSRAVAVLRNYATMHLVALLARVI